MTTHPDVGARTADTAPRASDGRYRGENAHAVLELRVDLAASGLVSGDLRLPGPGPEKHMASVRTVPEGDPSPGRWTLVAEDGLGAAAVGRLELRAGVGPDNVDAEIVLDGSLNGLPTRVPMAFSLERVDDELRTLGIEIEVEDGVEPPGPRTFEGRDVSVDGCLRQAGFAVGRAGSASPVPASVSGWDIAELHTLMQDLAQASLSRAEWELHLLLLSRATEPRLLGVMFDDTATLPRQGLAVFLDAIRAIPGIDTERKAVQTTVHEIGHALNLAHRFERVVGRADSASFMNYDWRYKGGDHRAEYWETFDYRFDPDELDFLRHGPRSAVIPGGAAFHSVRYWDEGTGGYSPYVPEAPLGGLEITVRPPAAGRLFAFGQPVFLEVELTNRTGATVELPPVLLDAKAGFLELLVRRTGGTSTRSLAGATPFTPIVARCFDLDAERLDVVPDGGSIRSNVNLVYGTGGFAFAEPGAYEVTALLALPARGGDRDLIVRSEPLPIRVAAPHSDDDERDAMDLFRDDVGVYLALGGGAALPGAVDALEQVRERRGRRYTGTDPVVAAIVRAQGLDARRSYVRYGREGGFRRVEARPDDAARLLGTLDAPALRTFDPATAEGTARLVEEVIAR